MGITRRLIATYNEAEDLINVGAYVEGSNPEIDTSIEKMPDINRYLVQGIEERYDMEESFKKLEAISGVSIPGEELTDEAISVQARETA